MGDGIQKKYAIIVNGDAEERHLGNVDRAIQTLRAEGNYEISVASTQAPNAKADHFAKADEPGLETLLAGMKGNMDDDDLLVVYFTGHGGAGKESEGCVQLTQSCVSLNGLANQLKSLPYGNRILVMDACFSGSGFNQFTDAKTTVVSQGSPGETVSCQNFSPFFWSNQVPDADSDGKISIQERFQFAVQQGKSASLLQYFSPIPIAFSGAVAARPFKTADGKPVEAHNGTELEAQLKRLKPGQVALVDFGADWCVPCKNYQPFFEKLAQEDAGKVLMIHAEGRTGSEEDWTKYGIKRYPTVAFIDWNGKVLEVADPKNPMATLPFAAVNSSEDQAKIFSTKLQTGTPEERLLAARGLAAMGSKAAPAVPTLTQALSDPDRKVQSAALAALAEVGAPAAPALPGILAALNRGDADAKISALKAIAAIGPKAQSAIPTLLDLFRSDLRKIVPDKTQDADIPIEQTSNSVFEKRIALIKALNNAFLKLAPQDPRVLQAYLEALRQEPGDYWHRHAAIVGMGLLKEAAGRELTILIPFLGREHESVYADIAIRDIAKASPFAFRTLLDYAEDKSSPSFRRFCVLRILGESEKKSLQLFSLLKKIAQDGQEDPRLRKFAAQLLFQRDADSVVAMARVLAELKEVKIHYTREEADGRIPPSAPVASRPWSWDSGIQSNARKGAVGGGLSFGVGYRFSDRFELHLDGNISAMAVEQGDKKTNPDFQWGLVAEPKLQTLGKADGSGLALSLGGLGFYHVVGAGIFDAYLVPLGFDANLKVLDDSQLGLSLKPQLHYDGDLKPGGAASLVWKGKF